MKTNFLKYEFTQDLINKDFVKLAVNANEVIDHINKDKFNHPEKNLFFKSSGVKNINSEINKILSVKSGRT